MKMMLGSAMLLLALATMTAAQEARDPRPRPAVVPTAEKAIDVTYEEPKAPQVSAADQQLVSTLQGQASALVFTRAVLQEKLDAVTAEWQRTIARLHAAAPEGYELTPQLTYVKKPNPAPVAKKEPRP